MPLGSSAAVDEFEGLLDRKAAARLLRVAPRTLDRWHLSHTGPPRIRMGRLVRYRRQAVEKWINSREEAV